HGTARTCLGAVLEVLIERALHLRGEQLPALCQLEQEVVLTIASSIRKRLTDLLELRLDLLAPGLVHLGVELVNAMAQALDRVAQRQGIVGEPLDDVSHAGFRFGEDLALSLGDPGEEVFPALP